MADTKYICIIVDDFSYRALDFPSVSLYDFTFAWGHTNYDNHNYDYTRQYPHGPLEFGDVDYKQTNFAYYDYCNVTDLYSLSVSDYGSLSPLFYEYDTVSGLSLLEEHIEYFTYQSNISYESSSEAAAAHGDYSDIGKSNTVFEQDVIVEAMSANLDVAMTGILLGDVNDTCTTFLDIT